MVLSLTMTDKQIPVKALRDEMDVANSTLRDTMLALVEAVEAYRAFDDVIDTLRDARREQWGRVDAARACFDFRDNSGS
jgi:hypothetical protein